MPSQSPVVSTVSTIGGLNSSIGGLLPSLSQQTANSNPFAQLRSVEVNGQLMSLVPVRDFNSFQGSMDRVTEGVYRDRATGSLYESISINYTTGRSQVLQQMVLTPNGPQGAYQDLNPQTQTRMAEQALQNLDRIRTELNSNRPLSFETRSFLSALSQELQAPNSQLLRNNPNAVTELQSLVASANDPFSDANRRVGADSSLQQSLSSIGTSANREAERIRIAHPAPVIRPPQTPTPTETPSPELDGTEELDTQTHSTF